MEGSIGQGMEIFETSVLPIPMVQRLHQSDGYIKKKLRVWRAKKYIALVGEETVITSAGPQTTPFHDGKYSHGTAFAPKQWLYQKVATGMESSKMYCTSWCRNRTYQCGAANYPVA